MNNNLVNGNRYYIELKTLNSICDYLENKPYKDVAHLFRELQMLEPCHLKIEKVDNKK